MILHEPVIGTNFFVNYQQKDNQHYPGNKSPIFRTNF